MSDDNNIFWDLLKREHEQANGFCRKLAGNRDDGYDLYQDAVLHALEKFGQLRETASFRPWLYRIILNSYRNRLQKPWWKRMVRLGPEHEMVPGPKSNERQILARMRLNVALRPLSPQDRSLLLLFETEQWTIAELSDLSGQSESGIKKRLSRSRKKMKKTLELHLKSVARATKQELSKIEDVICVAPKPKNK